MDTSPLTAEEIVGLCQTVDFLMCAIVRAARGEDSAAEMADRIEEWREMVFDPRGQAQKE